MLNNLLSQYHNASEYVKASVWFMFCMLLQKGISTISTPIFTRILTTEEYGQFSVFTTWMGIVTVFVTLSLFYGVFTSGLVRFEKNQAVFASSMQGMLLTMMIGWGIIYYLFQDFWNQIFSMSTMEMTAMLVLIWTSSVFNLWGARQRVLLHYKRLVTVTIATSVCTPVWGVFMVLHADDKVLARIMSMVLVNVLAYTWLFVADMKTGRTFFSAQYWRYALAMAVPLIPHYLSAVILGSADRIMIADIISESAAGIYSLGYAVSQIMAIFNTSLLQSLEPWIYKKIKDNDIRPLENVAYFSMALIALLNILFIAFAPEIVALFAPAAYYDAIWIIPPVAMSVYFTFLYGFFGCFEFYFRKTYFISLATILGAGLNILLNYILLDPFGYWAAGYTTLLCYMIFAIAHYIFMNRICRENMKGAAPYSGKKILSISFGFMFISFVLLYTYDSLILRYAMIAIVLVLLLVKRKYLQKEVTKLISIRKHGGLEQEGME